MKKRKKQYKWTKLFSVLIYFAIIAVFGVLSLTLPKPTVSEIERRELAAMPTLTAESLFSGSFTRDFETYYADTFPYRDKFVGISSTITELHGVRYDDVRIVNTTPGNTESEQEKLDVPEKKNDTETPEIKNEDKTQENIVKPAPDNNTATDNTVTDNTAADIDKTDGNDAADTTPDTAAPDNEEEPMFELERSGAVFIYGDKAFEIYGGDLSTAEAYANVVNEYETALPDGVQLYNMVIPTSVEMSLPKKYADSSQPQKPVIDHIYETLSADVKSVDAYSAIAEHKDEYIYFRTDHHWTGLGAYYGYTAFAEAAGFEPLDYDDYEKGMIEGFLGTLYASTQDEKLAENPDHVEYCKVPVETESYMYEKSAQSTPVECPVLATFAKGINSYSVYLYGDYPRFDIKNVNSNTGRNVLVIKESYGNAFAPYLIPHFDNTYVVDLRYYKLNILELIKKEKITDVVIVNNAFAVATKKHINSLEALLTN